VGKPAAKQGDKIIATDTHIIMIPSPGGPVPTPTPLPFSGTLVSGLSSDVFIEGKPAATVDSEALNQPMHIPAGGPFQKPPSNKGKILIGSTGVFINGKPAARQGDPATTCNDPADAPIGQVVAVGTVFIGETGACAPKPPAGAPKTPKLVKSKIGKPGALVSGEWQDKETSVNKEVKLLVDTKELDDGSAADFMVWQNKGGVDTVVKQLVANVQGNKVEVKWRPDDLVGEEKLKGKIEGDGAEKYYFVVEAEGEEKKSGELKLTYPLDVELTTDKGDNLDGAEFKIIFSDGSQQTGTVKGGHAKIENAPYGKFTLEVKGYGFKFSQ
jgi:uncharacterized Zn-binding protein involved in type VI secretion